MAIILNDNREYSFAVCLQGYTRAISAASPPMRDLAYVRTQAVQAAYDMLRHRIMDLSEGLS